MQKKRHKKIKSSFSSSPSLFVERHKSAMSFMIDNTDTLVDLDQLIKLQKILNKHIQKWRSTQ